MAKRKNHSPEFRAKVVLEALKVERTVAVLSSQFGVYPKIIHTRKKALLKSTGLAHIEHVGGGLLLRRAK